MSPQVQQNDVLYGSQNLRQYVRESKLRRTRKKRETAASSLSSRLDAFLEYRLQLLPISHVSRLAGLHWHTLMALDKHRLEATSGPSSRATYAAW